MPAKTNWTLVDPHISFDGEPDGFALSFKSLLLPAHMPAGQWWHFIYASHFFLRSIPWALA